MFSVLRTHYLAAIVCVMSLSAGQANAGEPTTSSDKPDFSPINEKVVLYLYREKKLKGAAMGNALYLNDEPLGELENGTYLRYVAVPGVYDLWVTNMPARSQGGKFHAATREISLSPGSVVYFKIVPVFGFYWTLDINRVDDNTAQQDISTLYNASR